MKAQTTPYAHSDAPHEGTKNLCTYLAKPYESPNNSPRPFGRLNGNHRLDLLLLPFLLSREEKEVGARGRSSCESPNEPPRSIKRTP